MKGTRYDGTALEVTHNNLDRLVTFPKGTIFIAYKFVDTTGAPPYYPEIPLWRTKAPLRYVAGYEYTEMNRLDRNPENSCGAGLNVATYKWCYKNRWYKSVLLKLRFLREDLLCVPLHTDGKFRVKRFYVEAQEEWRKP